MTNDILSFVGVHSLQRAMKPKSPVATQSQRFLSYQLAHRSAWDAGCRSAQRAGRAEWNVEDYQACGAEFIRLFHVDEP